MTDKQEYELVTRTRLRDGSYAVAVERKTVTDDGECVSAGEGVVHYTEDEYLRLLNASQDTEEK